VQNHFIGFVHFLFFYYQAEALSKVLIEKIKEEEQLLIHYYQEYEKTFAELKKLVDLAIIDDQFTEKAIVSLAEGVNYSHLALLEVGASQFRDESHLSSP